jgi:hypothetical protein
LHFTFQGKIITQLFDHSQTQFFNLTVVDGLYYINISLKHELFESAPLQQQFKKWWISFGGTIFLTGTV